MRSAKARAMLALLARSPEGRRGRGWLQEMLWGRSGSDHGRASLRRALADMRALLGDRFDFVFSVSNDEIRINPGSFEIIGSTQDGQLLEGLNINEEGFQSWLRRERQAAPPQAALSGRPLELPGEHIRPSIAIVPFMMTHGEAGHAILGDIIAEEATRTLSRSPLLHVISHLSARNFSRVDLDIEEVSRQLSVHYCICGSYRVVQNNVHLNVDVINVQRGDICWTGEFDASVRDFLAGQSELILDLANKIRRGVVSAEIQLASGRPLPDVKTHSLMITGVSLMHRTTLSSFARARSYIEEAIRRAPRHSHLYSWLGKWYVLSVSQGWSTDVEKDAGMGRDCVSAALDLNPECAFSLTIDGLVRNNLLKRPDESQECYDRALEVDPNNALAWLLTGTLNAFVGKGDIAVQQATRALALSPLDPHLYFFESLAATCHLTAFDFEKALELADRSMISNRRHASTHRVRTIALYGLGRYDEARQSAQELLRIEPGLTVENYLRNHPAALYPTGKYWAKALGESGIPK
ncbi:MAG: hypothetical protein AcusKO_14500 [Acuticoccus sp.]